MREKGFFVFQSGSTAMYLNSVCDMLLHYMGVAKRKREKEPGAGAIANSNIITR